MRTARFAHLPFPRARFSPPNALKSQVPVTRDRFPKETLAFASVYLAASVQKTGISQRNLAPSVPTHFLPTLLSRLPQGESDTYPSASDRGQPFSKETTPPDGYAESDEYEVRAQKKVTALLDVQGKNSKTEQSPSAG